MSKDYQDMIWKNNPEYIRKFYNLFPMHEKLCHEISYILKSELKAENIECAQITCRAKSLKSFCEKLHRKSYKSPFVEITDFSGVRIVFLYLSDLSNIERIIDKEFVIKEKVNKISNEETDKFGYGAQHYVVKMKKKHSGARYNDLKGLTCEIQIRTILQDAWAIVAHHLSYKQEEDIPKELRRKLNALSGLFETADDQFERIRLARNEYQEKTREDIEKHTKVSLNSKLNLDNLKAYIRWKFPERKENDTAAIVDLLSEIKNYGLTRLVDIENIVNKTKKAVARYESDYLPTNKNGVGTEYFGVDLMRVALWLSNKNFAVHRAEELDRRWVKYQNLIQ